MSLINDSEAFIESVKEFGRLVIFAMVGAGVAAAGAAVNLLPDVWMQVGAAALIASLGKAWDKYVHKSDANDITTGLTGF